MTLKLKKNELYKMFRLYHSLNVRNHVKLGVSLRALYFLVDTGYGLGRSLGDCRPALQKGRKYQIVKKKLRATLGGQEFEQTDGRSEFSFPLSFSGGQLKFVTQAFGDSLKLSSTGLATQ